MTAIPSSLVAMSFLSILAIWGLSVHVSKVIWPVSVIIYYMLFPKHNLRGQSLFYCQILREANLQHLSNYISPKNIEIDFLLASFIHWGRETQKCVVFHPLSSLGVQISHLLNSTHFSVLKPEPLGTLPSQTSVYYHDKPNQPQKRKRKKPSISVYSVYLVQNGQLLFYFVELGNGKNQLCTLGDARNITLPFLLPLLLPLKRTIAVATSVVFLPLPTFLFDVS